MTGTWLSTGHYYPGIAWPTHRNLAGISPQVSSWLVLHAKKIKFLLKARNLAYQAPTHSLQQPHDTEFQSLDLQPSAIGFQSSLPDSFLELFCSVVRWRSAGQYATCSLSMTYPPSKFLALGYVASIALQLAHSAGILPLTHYAHATA